MACNRNNNSSFINNEICPPQSAHSRILEVEEPETGTVYSYIDSCGPFAGSSTAMMPAPNLETVEDMEEEGERFVTASATTAVADKEAVVEKTGEATSSATASHQEMADPFDSLDAVNNAKKFLGTVGIDTAEKLLKTRSRDIGREFVYWRKKEGLVEIQLISAADSVTRWKQRVRKAARGMGKMEIAAMEPDTASVQKMTDPFDSLDTVANAKKFLGTVGIDTAEKFLNTRNTDIAHEYVNWRKKEGKVKLQGEGANGAISIWKTRVRKAAEVMGNEDVDPFDSLSPGAMKFLGTMDIDTAEKFLKTKTHDIAHEYVIWRKKEGMVDLQRNGASATVSKWKARVRDAARSRDASTLKEEESNNAGGGPPANGNVIPASSSNMNPTAYGGGGGPQPPQQQQPQQPQQQQQQHQSQIMMWYGQHQPQPQPQHLAGFYREPPPPQHPQQHPMTMPPPQQQQTPYNIYGGYHQQQHLQQQSPPPGGGVSTNMLSFAETEHSKKVDPVVAQAKQEKAEAEAKEAEAKAKTAQLHLRVQRAKAIRELVASGFSKEDAIETVDGDNM